MATYKYLDLNGLEYLCAKIKEYVAEYYDANIQAQVNAKLDEMLEDGTLQTLADTYFADIDLQDEVDTKIGEMAEDGTLEALMEVWLKKDGFVNGGNHTAEYLFTRYRQTGTSVSFDNTVPREMEGIVKTGDSKVIVFYRPSSVTALSDVLVEEIDFTDNKTPRILRSNTIAGIGSANNACYDSESGKIYSFVSDSTFAVIDYTSLTLEDTITIPDITLASCIAFDSVTKKYYITEGIHVWELNIETLETSLVYTFGNNTIKNALQGFEVKNNKFYFAVNNPRSVVVADIDGNIERIMNIDIYDNAGHYSSYIADITFLDDSNILITPHTEGDFVEMTRAKSSWYVNYVTKLNINGNNFEDNPISGVFASRELRLDTSSISDDVAYTDGSSSHELPLVSEYQYNKFKVLNNFRCVTSGTVTYYGTIIMDGEQLRFTQAFECEGGSINDSKFTDTVSIATKTSPLYSSGSEINTPTLVLGYNDASNKNSFDMSTLNIASIQDENASETNVIYNLTRSTRLGVSGKVLFSTDDIAGASNVTVGDIRSFKKIKVIVTDASSQQFSEEAIVPASGDIYLNFNRISFANTSGGNIKCSRMTIARTTGVITLDREYNVALAPDPTITITADSSPRVKILRVEGYYN